MQNGTEAAQFPEKDYINGIFVAVKGYSSACVQKELLLSGLSSLQNKLADNGGRHLHGIVVEA